ncbi:MAG TPA: hypothetical protein VGC22_00500 [Chitinophaga sp.]
MKRLTSIPFLLLGAAVLLHACNKDEKAVAPPVPGNEFLTTVKVRAVNTQDPTDVQVASWTDETLIANPPDSINTPVLNLKANATYTAEVLFLDETKTPAGDVTEEIKERQNYHLVCFTTTSGLNLTVKRTDLDTNVPALEVGLEDQFTTGAAGTGSLNVQLRHQPNAKNGSCDPGSTDADVTYTVNIK